MGGYAWDQHRQLEQHKSNTSRLRAQVQAAERQAAQAVAQSLQSFASLYSVEPRHTFELATQAWRATGEVTLRATDAATSLVLTVPLVNSRTYASRPSVEATIPRQVLADLIDYTPPAGCNAQPLATSGTFRDVQITLDCPTAHPGPARYRLD